MVGIGNFGSNDSICILHFLCRGRNGFGGITSQKMEYVYVKDNQTGVIREFLCEPEGSFGKSGTSILSLGKWEYEIQKKDSANDSIPDEQLKADIIYKIAKDWFKDSGREVGASFKNPNDVENW